jgi:hypothetical protein
LRVPAQKTGEKRPTRFTHDDIDTNPAQIFPKNLRFPDFSSYPKDKFQVPEFQVPSWASEQHKMEGSEER